MSRYRMQSHASFNFSPMKFPCKLGGLFHRWNSHVCTAEEALLLHNNHNDVSARVTAGFDRFTPALMQYAVISTYSSGMCKSLNGV